MESQAKLYRIEITHPKLETTGCADYCNVAKLLIGLEPMPLPSGPKVRRISLRDRFWFTQAGWEKYGKVLWDIMHNELAWHMGAANHKPILKERSATMPENEKITYSDEWQVAIRILRKTKA